MLYPFHHCVLKYGNMVIPIIIKYFTLCIASVAVKCSLPGAIHSPLHIIARYPLYHLSWVIMWPEDTNSLQIWLEKSSANRHSNQQPTTLEALSLYHYKALIMRFQQTSDWYRFHVFYIDVVIYCVPGSNKVTWAVSAGKCCYVFSWLTNGLMRFYGEYKGQF